VQQQTGNGFDFHPRTRLIFRENGLAMLADLTREYGGTRVLLVTDKGIVAAGHADTAQRLLSKAGLQVFTFDQAHENPTTGDVAACVEFSRQHDVNFIVGLGGGSSMDTAKGTNFILTNGGKMADYWGVNKATKPMLPMIAVPTTAGTGSECQSFALIADEHTHQKMACGDDKAYARVALLDPALTLSQPPRVTSNTGIDALTHALESHVTAARSPLSQLYSRESWKLAEASLETVMTEPRDLAARGKMLLASAYGGMAIALSMLGAAHSAANPLTARFKVVHGQAVGLMLPHVVRFNAGDPDTLLQYADLAATAGLSRAGDEPKRVLEALISRINALLAAAQIPASLEECGVQKKDIEALAKEAAGQWTAKFNPRAAAEADFRALYLAACEPRPAPGPAAYARQRKNA
jgi:alcohol dehydrogenase